MPEEEIRKRGQQIQEQIAQHLHKKLGIPVFAIDNDTIDMIYDDLVQNRAITDNYTSEELRREISDFISGLIVVRPDGEEEWRERANAFVSSLEVQKTFEATLIIPSVSGLPVGTRVGSLQFTDETVDDEKFREFLDYITDKEHIRIHGKTFATVQFQSYTTTNAVEILHERLELPFAALSLLLDFDLDSRDCLGYVKSTQSSKAFFLTPRKTLHGWSTYRPELHDNQLAKLSEITAQDVPTQLQKKIIQALQVYGLSRVSHKLEIRFILLIASLESLLLTKADRDYLGKKLAEKAAFLLETDFERRLELYRNVKKLYGKRSDLVHGSVVSVHPHEVRTLEAIFRELAFRLIEMSANYDKMEQKSHEADSPGVEDYIHELRFS